MEKFDNYCKKHTVAQIKTPLYISTVLNIVIFNSNKQFKQVAVSKKVMC